MTRTLALALTLALLWAMAFGAAATIIVSAAFPTIGRSVSAAIYDCGVRLGYGVSGMTLYGGTVSGQHRWAICSDDDDARVNYNGLFRQPGARPDPKRERDL